MSKAWRVLFCGVFLCSQTLAMAETASPAPSSESQPSISVEPPPEPPPATKPAEEAKREVLGSDMAVPDIKNIDQIIKDIKANRFKGKKFKRQIKVAVFEPTWSGWKSEIGKGLPANTDFVMGPRTVADNAQTVNPHGTMIAKLLAQIIAKSGVQADYKLVLFNTNGLTKFKNAVKQVIDENFDVVLHSQVWEFAGNGDGKGYLNTEVNKAVKAGIIWINAAGNYGLTTLKAPIDGKPEGNTEYVVFKDKKGGSADSFKITCSADKKAKEEQDRVCKMKMFVTWNDFKDDENEGTDKDLDVQILSNDKKTIIASSARKQRMQPDATDKAVSTLPREQIDQQLEPGTYWVRVEVKSKNFSASQDELRATIISMGSSVTIENPTIGQSVLPPGDNAGVITAGDRNTAITDTSKKLNKPEVFFTSLIMLSNGSNPYSTSNSAAIAAALTVLELGTGTEKSREAVLAKLTAVSQKGEGVKVAPPEVEKAKIPLPKRTPVPASSPAASAPQVNMPPPRPYDFNRDYNESLALLNARPPNGRCIVSRPPYGVPSAAQQLLRQPGVALIGYQGRLLILVSGDFNRYFDARSLNPDQRVFMDRRGLAFLGPQSLMNGIPAQSGAVEIVVTNTPICTGQRQ